MRKLLPIFLSLVILSGVAYALIPTLFPDTPALPRVPTATGTIGGVLTKIVGSGDLANYIGDGTVPNTRALDGVTASGYLRSKNCIGTDKWTGIDTANTPTCGTTSTIIGDFGKIESQDCNNSTIYHASGSMTTPTSTGWTLKSGDILQTPADCTITITFPDLSLLRLDGDTVVSFDIGYLSGGTTIAQALLENGSLWGRILTETGSYSVGTREIVAGVRGTSIYLRSLGNTIGTIAWQSGTGWVIPRTASVTPIEVAVIDTTTSTGATIDCRRTDGGYAPLTNLPSRNQYSIPAGGCTRMPSGLITPIARITKGKKDYLTDPWVRDNSRKDVEYMYRKVVLSGSTLPSMKRLLLERELAVTQPEESAPGIPTADGLLEAARLCPAANQVWWGIRHGCQDNTILAIADYTIPDPIYLNSVPPIYYRNPVTGLVLSTLNANASLVVPQPGRGVEITNDGQYLDYNFPIIALGLGIPDFNNKTIEVALTNPVDNNGGSKYIVSVDLNKYLYMNNFNNGKCDTAPINTSNASCGWNSDNNYFRYKIPNTGSILNFRIGNKIGSNPNNPIKNSIKRIIIRN